jgi:hypothetical protein
MTVELKTARARRQNETRAEVDCKAATKPNCAVILWRGPRARKSNPPRGPVVVLWASCPPRPVDNRLAWWLTAPCGPPRPGETRAAFIERLEFWLLDWES